MNRHAAKRLTERTLIVLDCLIKQAGNRTSRGGVPVEIPRETAEHIHALAYDATRGIAGKAQINGEVVA